jgi:preprotein translocase subunit SecD
VGRRLAIVLDGRAVSVPIVQTPIAGGRVMITMGGASGAGRSALPEAQAIAAALGGGRLSCSAWTLEEETTFGP